MSDNRSLDERVKDLRQFAESAPPNLRSWALLEVERMEKFMEQRRTEIMECTCIKKAGKQEGMNVKKIEIEMEFPDGFVPPEKFRGDTSTAENPCSWCPFFEWDDETREGSCIISGHGAECPIKKFF